MKQSLRFIFMIGVALLAGPMGAFAANPLKVVVSFSILADMTHQVGQDQVQITSLVGPNGDAHVYEPTPADALALKRADLLIVNGVGFEGWMDRLVESSEYNGPVVVATQGIELLEGGHHHHDDHHDEKHEGEEAHDDHHDEKHEGEEAHDDHHDEKHEGEEAHDDHHEGDEHEGENLDPHAWQSLANAQIYLKNIVNALKKADPAHADTYQQNGDRYLAKLVDQDKQIRAAWSRIPQEKRKIITPHDALAYYGKAYGVTILAPSGWSTESEATAKDVASIIRQMRESDVKALFTENIANPRLVEQIARDGGGVIGGKLFSDALSQSDGPAGTYLDMIWHNTQTMVKALSKTMQ